MKLTPTPGDPSTEPVATAQQSHVEGRVGPPTIAQDADAEHFVPEGVEQIEPGTVLPADTPWLGGVLPPADEDDERTDEQRTVHADAVPGNDEPQGQQSGPAKNVHPTATKAAAKK